MLLSTSKTITAISNCLATFVLSFLDSIILLFSDGIFGLFVQYNSISFAFHVKSKVLCTAGLFVSLGG